MDTLDKIIKALKDTGIKQIELTRYLGISKNVFSDWKAGRNNSYMKYLPKIAEFLNISTDYLLGRPAEQSDIIYSDDTDINTIIKDLLTYNIDVGDISIIKAVLDKYKS